MIGRVIDLLEVHREIDAALHETCLAVVAGNREAEERWGAQLGAVLAWHLEGEDRVLLPRYAALATEVPPFGRPEIIAEEHRRIEALVAEAGRGEPMERLARLRRLHHLLEHHDEREARSFKPALDQLLDADERARLLAEVLEGRPELPGLSPIQEEAAEAPDIPVEVAGDAASAVQASVAALAAAREHVARGGLEVAPLTDALERAMAQVDTLPADERFAKLRSGSHRKMRLLLTDIEAAVRAVDVHRGRLRLEAALTVFDRLSTLQNLAVRWATAALDIAVSDPDTCSQ